MPLFRTPRALGPERVVVSVPRTDKADMPYVASPMLIGDKRNFFGQLPGFVEQDQRYERRMSTEDRKIEPVTGQAHSERKRLASFDPESLLFNPWAVYQGHRAHGCAVETKDESGP
jgi:hypothetical protein